MFYIEENGFFFGYEISEISIEGYLPDAILSDISLT